MVESVGHAHALDGFLRYPIDDGRLFDTACFQERRHDVDYVVPPGPDAAAVLYSLAKLAARSMVLSFCWSAAESLIGAVSIVTFLIVPAKRFGDA
jgi:hypothetical protein